MIYKTIPIPYINFADEPEKEAREIFEMYFQSSFNIGYMIDNAKDYIRSKLLDQASKDDEIVILSYLINTLTEKIFNLDIPQSDLERRIQDYEAKPIYNSMLHFLYRMIETYGIEIPSDIFSNDEFNKANQILKDIDLYIEHQKKNHPDKIDILNETQTKIIKLKKSFWIGKEKFAELLTASLISFFIDKELAPHLPALFQIITSFFKNLFTLN